MRLFFAVTLPEEWQSALTRAAGTLRGHSRSGTFTRPENFHLTLAFLGEVADPAPALAAMGEVSVAPFSLRLSRPGLFRRREGDIWWVGLEPCPGLDALQRQLSARLRAGGFVLEERPFRPHLTLGRRVKLLDGFTPEDLGRGLPPLALTVDSFALMRSERVQGILTYTPVGSRRLFSADS